MIFRSVRYHARYYRLIAIAVAIMTAIITGSMVTGDSVRSTLIKRVNERLGTTESIVFSQNSFISDKILETTLFMGGTARGVLLTNGFMSQNGKLIPVFVWGADDMGIEKGEVKVNPSLAKEIFLADYIVLRLPATGLVPSGSLFVTDNYTTSLRLKYDGIVAAKDGGNISLKNEQTLPFNVFVNRDELSEILEINGKINLILSATKINPADFDAAWSYEYSGLKCRVDKYFTEISSDRIFLQEEVTDLIISNNKECNRLFSYMANAIENSHASVPYSFVTAADKYRDTPLRNDEMILSDYTARRLNAKIGDSVRITFFTSKDLKVLTTDTIALHVKEIVPLAELLADTTLSADFPGLSDVERCTDWDSDLPINMDLITDEDERYWELYRSTPKAIIPYPVVAGDWGNAYGNATAVRVSNGHPDLSGLKPGMFGIQLVNPRESSLFAARNGVDFSGLFLALGCFIIIAAAMLMLVPVSEMLYRRKDEIATLQTLGYRRRRITKILWMESFPVVLTAAVAGIAAGLLYTMLVMWLLGNVWKGATHTDGFSIYPAARTVITGFVAGIATSLILLRISIVRNLKRQPVKIKAKTFINPLLRLIATIIALAAIFVNLFFVRSVALFVIIGIVIIGAGALWGDFALTKQGSRSTGLFTRDKIIWSRLFAGRKQAMLSFFTLTTGVFMVFTVGLNRQSFADSDRLRTGTGGFSLWGESNIPVYHDFSTAEGREKLSLTDLPPDAVMLQCLRHSADDASCLNLNKVSNPSVLGVDVNRLLNSDFKISRSLNSLSRNEVFRLLEAESPSVIPAIVDETVLTWGLMRKLGDTLYYKNDNGENVAVQLIATLDNSIFQGNIIIGIDNFRRIWHETTGSEVFLAKVDDSEKNAVKTLLEQALSEYGVRVQTCNERLEEFNSVTDTYLTIFMSLGCLGLLLGLFGFIIVIRKNLVMRSAEIDLFRALGYNDTVIARSLYRENIIVPVYAIAVGVVSSFIAVSANLANVGIFLLLSALLLTFCLIAGILFYVKKEVKSVL